MSLTEQPVVQLRHLDRFFIGGEWVAPSSDATITVTDSATEERFFAVAEAQAADIARAVEAARAGVRRGPVAADEPRRRAEYLRAIAAALRKRGDEVGDIWPRESGVLHGIAKHAAEGAAAQVRVLRRACRHVPVRGGGAADGRWQVRTDRPRAGGRRRRDRSVERADGPDLEQGRAGVAGGLHRGAEVLAGGAGEGYLLAEIAEEVGLPPGVLNVVTADREVSELLVRDPRVDKITFTGSTAAGRRIASICGERIARCTLELGGKSAAVILDDIDVETVAGRSPAPSASSSGQVCSSLTRIVVPRHRHDELLDALSSTFSQVRVGDPFDPETQMGPLASERQRDRVLGYIDKGVDEGATLATGGSVPLTSSAAGSSSRRCSATSTTLDDRARGDLRPGPERDPGRRRTRRRARRQRHDLRTERLGVHRRRGAGPRGRGRAPLGHRRPQRVPDRLRDRVRRLQAVRDRPRGRNRGALPVPRDQDGDPRGADRALRGAGRLAVLAADSLTRGSGAELWGRRRECDALDRLIDAVRREESQALVLRGDPGVGKTALLGYLVARASGCRVVRAAGVQSEMELAFASLHQLVVPMLDGIERLPAPQCDAVRTAFGMSAGPAPDRFLLGLAILGLLADAAEERPVICIVDDEQWLDRASAQTLAFVARRLDTEAVALVFAARTPGDELAGLPELDVRGLREADARGLLESALAGPLDDRIRDRIVSEARGNPLALLELPGRRRRRSWREASGSPARCRSRAGSNSASVASSGSSRSRLGGCCISRRPIRWVSRRWCGPLARGSRSRLTPPDPRSMPAGRVRDTGPLSPSAGALGGLPVGIVSGPTRGAPCPRRGHGSGPRPRPPRLASRAGHADA